VIVSSKDVSIISGSALLVGLACILLGWRFGFAGPIWTDGVATWEPHRAIPPKWLVASSVALSIGGLAWLTFGVKQHRRIGRIVAGAMSVTLLAAIAHATWVEFAFRQR
jgi:hypothetical protein